MLPIIWLYAGAPPGPAASALIAALDQAARPLRLGPGWGGEAAIDLGAEGDLALALETCPPDLRPRACAVLGLAPAEAACLPCPVLGLGAPGPDGSLPPDPAQAAGRLLEAAAAGRDWPWLARVQVNVPLRQMLTDYLPLVEACPVRPEVGIDSLALDTLDQGYLARAREILAGRRVTCHLPFFELIPASFDPLVARTARERILAGARWALELGAVQCVAHLGFDERMHLDLPAFADRFAACLEPVARLLAQAGAGLALENTFEPDPQVLLLSRRALAERAGLPVGICLDAGHSACFSRTDLRKWWPQVKEHVTELHLHDNLVSYDHHLPVGWGSLDWAWLGRALSQLDQAPVLTLEPHREAHLWASLRGLEAVWGADPDWPWL